MAASTMLSANRDILGKKADSKNTGKSAPSERSAQPPINCPECHSSMIWKDGFRYIRSETGTIAVQRYICRDCGRRFSESLSYLQPNRRGYNRQSGHSTRQVCVALAEGSKNLVTVESRIEKQAAGATTKTTDVKTKIFEYAWWMKKEGYAESTITRTTRLLKTLSKRGANLWYPESVKQAIANQENWCNTTKEHAVTAYTSFLKMHGETWRKPRYNRVRKLPFIPTEKEIDQLIASCNKKTAAFLQLLKETAIRRGEAWSLKWTDFNFENRTVRVTPEKGSNPRMLKISSKLIAMLNLLPQDTPKPFVGSLRHFARSYRRQRNRASYKLQNQRIKEITFHTFRHWKATMEYHTTKDILHVKQLLGHKSIQNTMLYTQLVNFEDDRFTCKTAETVEEAKELIEAGFEHVTHMDSVELFRKPK